VSRKPPGLRAFRVGQEALDGLARTGKVCRTCGEFKTWDRLVKAKVLPDGHAAFCKDCKQAKARADYAADPLKYREKQMIAKFGMSYADYDRMLEAQGGGCAICGRTDSKGRGNWTPKGYHASVEMLHIDHDYNTGKVRQLLCGSCNRGIGLFGDDIELLEKAAAYLRKHNAKPRGAK
jgi:hypothetical protein